MNNSLIITLLSGLGVYLIGSTGGFIWWMATMTEQVKTLTALVKALGEQNGLYAKKEDIARELGVIEKNQETMWTKFEKLKEKVDTST